MTRKDIPGLEGLYAVTSDGRIYGYKRNHYLKLQTQWAGYKIITLSGKTRAVHRIVAESFMEPAPTPKHEINHIDGDKNNNSVTNLEWLTRKDNILHGYRIGIIKSRRGEKSSHPKLTDEQVIAIRGVEGVSKASLARKYGVDASTISLIIHRKRWTHI